MSRCWCKRISDRLPFKTCSSCARSKKKYKQTLRGTCTQAICNAKDTDKQRGFDVEELVRREDYITAEWMQEQWELQGGKCYYSRCNHQEMQHINCREDNGLTLERIDNTKPHTKGQLLKTFWIGLVFSRSVDELFYFHSPRCSKTI